MSTLYALLPPLGRFDAVPAMRAWLARGDRLEAGATGEQATASYFLWPGSRLPAAALMRAALDQPVDGHAWLCLDPAHVRPDMTGARMLACGDIDLDAAEADALARPLRPLFGDAGMRLETTLPSRWHLRLPADSPLPDFHAPAEVLGDDITRYLPAGPAGRRWRQLFNESQILLHQNPLNREREAHAQLSVNSLWPWGGGRLPAWVKTGLGEIYADDLLPRALAGQTGVATRPLDTFDASRSVRVDTLLDLGRSASPQACMALLSDVLGRRRVRSLVLHFATGERWRVSRWQRWRVWRGVS